MRCVACNKRITHPTKRQVKIPHPSGKKNHYKIVHEEEKLCSVCVGYSELHFDDEDIDFNDLGLCIDKSIFQDDTY